jgi:rhodanese-related sulfurtransferase
MSIRNISADEMREAAKEDTCNILDVREKVDFEAEHVPLAINMPIDEQDMDLKNLDKDKTLIVYCRAGGESKKVAQDLSEQGFKDVRVLEGGFMGWKRGVQKEFMK